MKGQTTITGGTVEGLIKKQDDGTLSVTGGTFTENPSAYVDSSAAAATVTSGSTTTYAVGNDSIQKAAEGGGKVEVTQGSVNIESTKLPEGTTIIAKGGTVTVDSNPVGDTGYTKPAAPKPSSGGYSGPEVRYVGGNTFEATTSEAPREVRIDGQPVSFTMNGNRITVSGMPSGASRVTVSWGSSTFSTNFRPDAAAYSGSSVTIPKTGGASVTAYAIMALAAAAGILRRK